MRKELARKYRDQFSLEWVSIYGFNNTYGLVMRRDLAERHNIATFADLGRVAPELVFGAEYDFFERDRP